MSDVFRSGAAQRDLDEIWDYIALDNPNAADRLLERIGDRCEEYAGQPEMGSLATEIDPTLSADVRWFPVGNYVVFYLPLNDDIVVVRVLHGRRDIPQVFRDKPLDDVETD